MDIHGSNVHIQLSSNIQIFIIYPMWVQHLYSIKHVLYLL
jgi:hypothetical protein